MLVHKAIISLAVLRSSNVMVSLREYTRIRLVVLLALVVLAVSACYKDAGENVQPTSNRVDLSDIQPTVDILPTDLPTATSALEETAEPDESVEPGATATRTLLPTITPAGETGDADTPSSSSLQVAPSFTPAPVTPTLASLGITTPGMSDIIPTATITPTIDPALLPTSTPYPPGFNPCAHVVQPGDTLYSIARDEEVELGALVAANAALLGGSEFTMLQLGWELNIPGCVPPGAEPPPAETGSEPATAAPGQQTTHIVQAGDTIYSIGRQYGVSPDAIIAANNLANPNRLDIGQTLIIPAP